MIFFNNFQKKVQIILKKIEQANANESDIASLCKLLDSHPDITPEVIGTLNNILLKGSIKAYNLVILAFNKMAQNYIGLEYYSVDVIVSCMHERKNDVHENNILNVLEILSKITQKYPQRMGIAVPELLICLENTDTKSRELSYFILSILAAAHHEFFKGRSKEIIRVLNGLNVDERIYAIRLTKKLAQQDQAIVADTFDLLEDMRLNHPDSNLRSEAGFAMDTLKEAVKKKPHRTNTRSVKKMQKPDISHLIKGRGEISDNHFSGLSELRSPDKKDLADILEGMNLKHLIVDR